LKPAAFTYHRPTSLDEALALLAEFGASARLLAGGQSLGPMLNLRMARPEHVIDVNDLTEFAYVRQLGDFVEVGGLTRHHQVAQSPCLQQHCPLLTEAASTIGHYAIRQRGTLGGSLANADPAAQLALVAVTLGAQMTLVRRQGQRQLTADEFFIGAMTTALQPQEMLQSVRFPKFKANEASAFCMFNRRHGDFAMVAAATTVTLQDGRAQHLRLALGGVAPTPLRLDQVAQQFEGRLVNTRWAEDLATAAAKAIEPPEDERIPASYRKELAKTLSLRAIHQALKKLEATA